MSEKRPFHLATLEGISVPGLEDRPDQEGSLLLLLGQGELKEL
jgi:hypothetical protein